ncbi:hypothetical protein F4809DRAFT_366448 [Biscogniauxia mediterranea]|nr:hypothetical protein F4809DRAFT_366448 [Biscogniauxia mediterranea]
MAETTRVFSLQDIMLSSESSSATTPSSTTASDEQRGPVHFGCEPSAEDTDSDPQHRRPPYAPSLSPKMEHTRTEDQPNPGVEDAKSVIVTKVMNLLSTWSKLHTGTATGISTETKEALFRHLNTRIPQSPGPSLPKRSGGDASRENRLDSSETTGNCVISHSNFETLLGMIHDAGRSRAFNHSMLKTMEKSMRAQTTMAQDEKLRADRLETRLQDMQRRYDMIQEEKQGFQREAQKANWRLEELMGSQQSGPQAHTRPANEQLNVDFGLRMLRISEGHLQQSLLERTRLRDTIDQAKEETALLQAKLVESERQNQKLANECALFRSRLGHQVSGIQDLRSNLVEERATVRRLQSRVDHVEHSIAKAKGHVDKLERRLEREKSKRKNSKRKATAHA